jgi:hypothetical protein
MPPIAVRDLAIQARETDLVAATFGRGFYVLDDYTALRHLSPTSLEQAAVIFPVRAAWMYFPSMPLGLRDKAFLGESLYTAENPPFGAVFTYYLRDELKSKRKARRVFPRGTPLNLPPPRLAGRLRRQPAAVPADRRFPPFHRTVVLFFPRSSADEKARRTTWRR